MLTIIDSKAKLSQIALIGEKVKQLEKESGLEYLYLNQGVNAVVPIDLTEVLPLIDFNAKEVQNYAPGQGRQHLKLAINKTYFNGSSQTDNLLITNGGMSGLDLLFQSVEIEKVVLPAFFWGSYAHILNIRGVAYDFYEDFDEIEKNAEKLQGSAVLICDPNNPVGNKFDDKELIALIKLLDKHGVMVIVDSPYRGVFYSNDIFYAQIAQLTHVVIVESFSKSIGLSGQRIGFVHSSNADLMHQLAIRLMYSSNGVNAFAQVLVEKLLTTKEGQQAITDFKNQTTRDIRLNINYLMNRGLLANSFYKNSQPKGIFVVVNRSFDELLAHRIASVSLSFFTKKHSDIAKQYARICVSVPHDTFVRFFNQIEL